MKPKFSENGKCICGDEDIISLSGGDTHKVLWCSYGHISILRVYSNGKETLTENEIVYDFSTLKDGWRG